MADPVRVALRFANEINRHDVEGLLALVSDDHVLVDSLGKEVHGREKLREVWKSYFELFPDYHIDVRESFQNGPVVALFGTATGSSAPHDPGAAATRWRIPAAWRALVERDLVVHWQVFADNEPVWKSLGVKRY